MSAKHTPGPWSAAAPDGSYHDVIRIFADADPEGATPVAVCPQRHSAAMSVLMGRGNATTEAAANARLIAAAPEMFEALGVAGQELWNALEMAGIGQPGNNPAYNVIRAAIAKATGK